MNGVPPPRPFYLVGEPDPVFAILHPPAGSVPALPGVLLLPPFGWEDVCSYRPRREWAEHLARAGHPVLRIDLPGTADSGGGPRDPNRLAAWTAGACAAATWLGAETGGGEVAAIGIGLGGLVACLAVQEAAPIDQLVLWGTPGRGRALVRELRAFARLEAMATATAEGPPAPPLPEGLMQAGGFVLTDETRSALEAVDLGDLALRGSRLRRALLLERDGIAPDAALVERLEAGGVAVRIAPGPGWGTMMEEPQEARAPREVLAVTAEWLGQDAGRRRGVAAETAVETAEEVRLRAGGITVRERPVKVTQPFGGLFGILAQPEDRTDPELCAVLLNAGGVRRIGPNRMWVELARRWTARGVPTFRLDVEGLGDSDGDALPHYERAVYHTSEYVEQVRATLDALEARGLPGRFVLLGLCAGAFQAFTAAAQDPRVVAALMVNPQVLAWDPGLPARREARRYRRQLRPSFWRGLPWRDAPARLGPLVRALVRPATLALRSSSSRPSEDEVPAALDRMRERDVRVLFAFGQGEPLHEELERDGILARAGDWPNLEVVRLPGTVHTLRPLALQQHVHALLDSELDRALVREEQTGSRGTCASAASAVS